MSAIRLHFPPVDAPSRGPLNRTASCIRDSPWP
ncbi:hypothetical protein T11_6970 [Trichinella zimbabwensis]|uniref:Uncharacterized protein n=1 Tax=Trichinella zimbabwensis TaxID=268475 RepID=A0A0V1IAA0_9BILA|nr:hypothetical protein T11_6970 [Trichinella zimbabwensis]